MLDVGSTSLTFSIERLQSNIRYADDVTGSRVLVAAIMVIS